MKHVKHIKQNEWAITNFALFLLKNSKYFRKFTQRFWAERSFSIMGYEIFSHFLQNEWAIMNFALFMLKNLKYFRKFTQRFWAERSFSIVGYEIFSHFLQNEWAITCFHIFAEKLEIFFRKFTQKFWAERSFSIMGYEIFSHFLQNEWAITNFALFMLKNSKYFRKLYWRYLMFSAIFCWKTRNIFEYLLRKGFELKDYSVSWVMKFSAIKGEKNYVSNKMNARWHVFCWKNRNIFQNSHKDHCIIQISESLVVMSSAMVSKKYVFLYCKFDWDREFMNYV